jgi:FemAB-related protein (PEP-CTERM system-associated)
MKFLSVHEAITPDVSALVAEKSAAWDAFVRTHPEGTFFHLAGWRDVLVRAFGHRSHYLIAERGGQVCGVLPLAEVKSKLFGHALVSTPFCVYGGIVATDEAAANALRDRACQLAKALNVDHLEMRNRRRQHPDWPAKDLYVTFRKPILADSEANMLAIPRKQRAMVRKGIQKGLRSEVDASVDRVYDTYSESLRNLGTPVFSRRYMRILKEVFGDACEALTILSGDRPVAGVISFLFREEVIPYYGGGTSEARAVAGNDFLYWEVMERARQQGKQLFDYGRSKRDSGAFDFKKNWGFEPQPLFYEYFLVKAHDLPNLNPNNPKYSLFIKLWQRLPLWLSRKLGPFLAGSLG